MMTQSTNKVLGVVRAIAFRPTDSEPMRDLPECAVLDKRGIDLENRKHGTREVTLLSEEAWREACRDVGRDLSWHLRRANFLVSGVELEPCIGQVLAIGEVHVRIHGETRPCHLMDAQCAGLTNALKPNCRGGVHGQVVRAGSVRVGAEIRALPPDDDATTTL